MSVRSARRPGRGESRRRANDWLKPLSPTVFYTSLPSGKVMISRYEISLDDLEKIVKYLKDHEGVSETLGRLIGKEYYMLLVRKKRLEERLSRFTKEKKGPTVKIVEDRFEPGRKIGKVVSPREYSGMIVFFANQKMVENFSVGEYVTLAQYDVRTSTRNKKYIVAFKIYEEEEYRILSEIDRITSKLRELEEKWLKDKILELFARNNISLGELIVAIDTAREKDYSQPYNYKSFINFLDLLRRLKNKEIVYKIKEFIREEWEKYANEQYGCYLYVTEYGLEAANWIYSVEYLVVPLPGGVEFDLFTKDDWIRSLEKYLIEHNVYDKLKKIGKIDGTEYSCESLGGCILTVLFIKPHYRLSPEKIAEINKEVTKMKIQGGKEVGIAEIIDRIIKYLDASGEQG